MNFEISKNLAEHLGLACGTLVFHGTVVGNHWLRHSLLSYAIETFNKAGSLENPKL
jgi:hypothetical protein